MPQPTASASPQQEFSGDRLGCFAALAFISSCSAVRSLKGDF